MAVFVTIALSFGIMSCSASNPKKEQHLLITGNPSTDDCNWSPVDPDTIREMLVDREVPAKTSTDGVYLLSELLSVDLPAGGLISDESTIERLNQFVLEWNACVNKGFFYSISRFTDDAILDSPFARSLAEWDQTVKLVSDASYSQPVLGLIGTFGWMVLDSGGFGLFQQTGIGPDAAYPDVEFVVLRGTIEDLWIAQTIGLGDVDAPIRRAP
ncbi:MAG TPA: hypothetical protein PK819_06860 [Thermomicrobiales bacterium]|nr:hypothetical protein [Thermomicrobiales bacterium]